MEAGDELALRTLARVSRRLIPFLCCTCSYLDQVNVGYAALLSNRELHFKYGLWTGAGLFFLSPHSLRCRAIILLRVGPRRWIGASWCGASLPAAASRTRIYLPRFLGAAEVIFPHRALFHFWFAALKAHAGAIRRRSGPGVGAPLSICTGRMACRYCGLEVSLLVGRASVLLGYCILRTTDTQSRPPGCRRRAAVADRDPGN